MSGSAQAPTFLVLQHGFASLHDPRKLSESQSQAGQSERDMEVYKVRQLVPLKALIGQVGLK